MRVAQRGGRRTVVLRAPLVGLLALVGFAAPWVVAWSTAGAVDAPPAASATTPSTIDYTGWSQWEDLLPPGLAGGGGPGGPAPAAPPVPGAGSSGSSPAATGSTPAASGSTPAATGTPPTRTAGSDVGLPPAQVLGATETAPGLSAQSSGGAGGAGGSRAAAAGPSSGEDASSGSAGDLSFVSTGISDRIDLSPARVLGNVGLGALITLILVASSQLFNDAMKMHHDRLVSGAAGRFSLLRWLSGLGAHLPHPPIVVSFALVAGALGLLSDPSVAFSATTLGQMLGMGLAVAAIVTIYDGTASRSIARRSGLVHRYRLYPVAIAVAIGCLLLSRIFDVAPGVLYGLFAGVIFTGAVDSRLEGRVYARSSVLLVVAALLAWAVHREVGVVAGSSPGLWAVALDTAAAALFVGGLQAVIVQLLPTRYVNGEKIAAWNRWAWLGLLVGTMAIYLQFVVRPNPDAQSWSNLWFVGAFVVVAVGFWAVCAVLRWSDENGDDGEPDPTRPGAEELAGGVA